ncbi:PEP-CTERM sorting domain-containing protein [Massilia sp. PAMC28688]|uniref:PEP-CTERM sorting domain-containing protein n=1 Tax=Massilia sp. PAMC28688 TaxID=2861283 RepID=UPI001C62EDD9|nr:PEP-CTERM sorting domain-containing protein [Massilia sp. PAMC28688]QYF95159.1 PEP-CTERM sorting domain-containing protein [Massilia sp. PAMC28688]
MFALRSLRPLLVAASLLCTPLSQAQVSAQTGSVYLEAEWGNHVGYELDGPTTWMHGVDGIMYGSDHVSRANDGVNLFFERGDQRWLLQFVAPAFDPASGEAPGNPLRVGRYDNVMGDWRFAPKHAGMLISSPMGEVWDWSGWFNVREIAYADNGDLARFAVDFRQYDTLDQTGPALIGSLRYNSTIGIHDVPEPGSVALVLLGLGLTAWSVRRRRA